MRETPSYIKMITATIPVFAGDGAVDMDELNHILTLALEDGHLCNDEKRVLRQFFKLALDGKVSRKVRSTIEMIQEKYNR